MDMLPIVICVVIAVFCIVVAAQPLMKTNNYSAKIDTNKRHLTETKEQILSSLRELEFDQQLGKLHAEEYEPLRKDLENKAIVVIDQLDRLEQETNPSDRDLIKEIEAEISKIKQDDVIEPQELPRGSNFCSQCGHKRLKEDKYCTYCGNAFNEDS
tara:strand:- start:537 stop:1004 length:468 start_codon:yes stop_codon:yes gene_type:complete